MDVAPTTSTATSPLDMNDESLWYKDAVIYQLHVRAFADSNNDGIGDFAGLIGRLDYLQDLGVTALWLLPFYPSPGRDDGYDIADYGTVNPDYGTMKDFKRFVQEAKKRDLRVITELVINHTSDQHKWFKRARRSPVNSSARNWYVWSDTDRKYSGTRIIFSDTEKSNWTWDPTAGQFYWHRFFSHQPDLNFDNPRVVDAVIRVMKRWLDAGVDGFRLDAIPYLCEMEGTNSENLPQTHEVIKRLRKELDLYSKHKLLLAEANQWPEDVKDYFGNSDECHMAYHFPLMPRIFMAISQEDRFPITDIMRQTPDIPADCQWALFLRNHDELTLEMVTDVERDYLWSAYADDPRSRINVGIRRRLAPLMGNDRRKIELMNSLLLSFPGTPIIYYGDEIGMGDNIYLGDRNGVRTPMQWTPDRNGGFSRADPARLYAPPIMDSVYGYESVNVEAQSRSLSSLLSATKRLISVRKTSNAFGRGNLTFIRPANRAVIAYVRQYGNEVLLCVANLSRSAQATELDLSAWKTRVPLEILGRTRFPAIGDLPYMITLTPYGFYWFQLEERDKSEIFPEEAPTEFVTLVVPSNSTWMSLERTRGIFEREVLPGFLANRRWFPERDPNSIRPTLLAGIPFSEGDGDDRPWLTVLKAQSDSGPARYLLPIAIQWVRFEGERQNPRAMAAVRQGHREGTLMDVATDPAFVSHFLRNLQKSLVIDDNGLQLSFIPTRAFPVETFHEPESIRAITGEQSNSTALVDADYVVKLYRRFETGSNPEIEMGRFLTEETTFANTPSLIGTCELAEGGQRSSVGVVHRLIENQGDGWAVSSAYLDRFFDEQRLSGTEEQPSENEQLGPYLRLISQTGRRLAELHLALGSRNDIMDFAPAPIQPGDVSYWTAEIKQRAERVFVLVERRRPAVRDRDVSLIDQLLKYREHFSDRLNEILPKPIRALKIRHHGDFHLGQMLVAKDDIFIIDFEGEPKRTFAERRHKMPAARDVAGLIRSLDYSVMAALERAKAGGTTESQQVETAVEMWRSRTLDSFLSAYRETVGASPLWPTESGHADKLLKFFLLEKALYEIEYELAYRPDWVHVPLKGAVTILLGDAFL
jgi:maltose alpha-D-glucosyltransferase / alpha-amylase